MSARAPLILLRPAFGEARFIPLLLHLKLEEPFLGAISSFIAGTDSSGLPWVAAMPPSVSVAVALPWMVAVLPFVGIHYETVPNRGPYW